MTTEPEPAARVSVLLDATDDAAVTAALLARHDPLAGCVVVHPTPGTYGRLSLAHDLLAALGRPIGSLRSDRVGGVGPAWLVAAAWLAADRIEHLVVLRAHRIPTACWVLLAQLARTSGVALLLVCHTPAFPPRQRSQLHGIVNRVLTDPAEAAAELDATRGRPVERTPRPPYADLPGRLPTSQVLHYRADVFRQHPRELFARIDDLYGYGLDTACQWLRGRPRPTPRRALHADEALQRFLTELVHDSPTVGHTLALLRGVQAGFLLHGSWFAVPAHDGDGLCGPGLTSSLVTFDVAERIRAGVAHPVLAAGVALALCTGIDLRSLRSLRLDQIPAGEVVLLPFRKGSVRESTRRSLGAAVPDYATVVFPIPPAARPLIEAAQMFLRSRHPQDLYQRLFASVAPMRHSINEAAGRCGLRLPADVAELSGAWQLRVRWIGLDEAVHTDAAGSAGAGRSCLTAQAAAADPAGGTPLYQRPGDGFGRRWSPINAPTFLPDLLRAYLDDTEPTLRGWHEAQARSLYINSGVDASRRRSLVEQHLAVWVPPTGAESSERITMHPDIAFALRLADRPAPASSAATYS